MTIIQSTLTLYGTIESLLLLYQMIHTFTTLYKRFISSYLNNSNSLFDTYITAQIVGCYYII